MLQFLNLISEGFVKDSHARFMLKNQT
jgi:hypothetical protein